MHHFLIQNVQIFSEFLYSRERLVLSIMAYVTIPNHISTLYIMLIFNQANIALDMANHYTAFSIYWVLICTLDNALIVRNISSSSKLCLLFFFFLTIPSNPTFFIRDLGSSQNFMFHLSMKPKSLKESALRV